MIGYYDKGDIALQLRDKLEGRTQVDLAAEMEITPQYLSDVLSGRRDPGPKILEYLGLKVGYVRDEK
jgi:transcriptional regulator with XRE-family HTH domain